MAIDNLEFSVEFKPVPWKRPAGKAVRYDSQTDDKAAFTLKALDAIYSVRPALKYLDKPWFGDFELGVALSFFFAGPKMSTSLPDVDNLAKFVLDAMQSQYLDGVIWHDDKQVCYLSAQKALSSIDSVNVKIWRL